MEEKTLTLEEIQAIEDPADKTAKLLDFAKKTEEAKRKHESDTDAGVKKILDEKKYLELISSEAKTLLKNKNYFPELLAKDEGLAKKVLDEFFDGISIDDAMAQVDDKEAKAKVDTKAKEKEVEDTVKAILTKTKVEEKVSSFISKVKLSDEDKTAFDKEFKDLTEWKKLDTTNIDKYLRLAFKEALPEWDFSSIEADAKEMAIQKWWQTHTKWAVHNARKSNIEYLKSQWFF